MNKIIFALSFFSLTTVSQISPGNPTHSSVEKKFSKNLQGVMEFTFISKPQGNMVINEEAPWQLTINDAQGLELPKMKFNKADFKPSVPGFTFSTSKTPAQKNGVVEFEMVSFVCTKDKSQCFRDVEKGSLKWSSL